ncbi:hypothetical protein KP509_06G009300 [Ceratopteris richardii]|uniref:UspA domain-containing protein n=1 Tax=Ceratopteris richardii TaxID=49495 RepID=A0A8T2UKC7_CERRI|nr:hypothetical protein KP509_06G009300 [Ceratopteris richardii]
MPTAFVPLDSYADNALSQYGIKRDDELLDLLKTEAPQKDNVVFKVYWGDAREKICDAVTDLPLNFLVMGSRGLGPLKRTLLGSVSNHVVNSAACPVTVVKAPFDGTSHGAK